MHLTPDEVNVRRRHNDTHKQVRDTSPPSSAYNFAKRLKTLQGPIPYEANGRSCADEPGCFRTGSVHVTPGLSTYGLGAPKAPAIAPLPRTWSAFSAALACRIAPQLTNDAGASSAWRRMNAACASLNFDLFMVASRSMAQAPKRENSSSNRSSFREHVNLGG